MIDLAENGWLPDYLIRMGIRRLLAARIRQERLQGDSSERALEQVRLLKNSPIALATDQANTQHYEVPAEFFKSVLGPRLKYSCCLYPHSSMTLGQAEECMLRLTCTRAELEDGMKVLDLGCGWGSLSLWIAEHYPRCQVTALSNSTGQRRFIEARANERGLDNIRVITANITNYVGDGNYDRVISVEMFEHLRNYETILARLASWLRPEGKLFVHIFCHREWVYTFDVTGHHDWMARHFFTGGLMPSFNLLGHFNRDLIIRQRWQVDGRHYARTCEAWLRNLDANHANLISLFATHFGRNSARIVLQRWRMFFMACAELFGFRGGTEWFVGHYLFEPRANTKFSYQNDLNSEQRDSACWKW
ncbi:MAG: SAM-dependent methyltransferase [Gemmataceae bacterium]